jgi:hypothetical protein
MKNVFNLIREEEVYINSRRGRHVVCQDGPVDEEAQRPS